LAPEAELLAQPLPGIQRVLGTIRGARPGPTLLGVGGLHGNEPAGILALQRVLDAMEGREGDVSGDFVALAGNRAALAERRRYLARDLNRSWISAGLEATAAMGPDEASPEDLEQIELLEALEVAMAGARGPVYLLDLHTTSGPGKPFSTILDSLASRKFAFGIPVPLVVGLGELVEGTLLGYLAERGIPGIVFEGGKHDSPNSIGASEAAIWLSLARTGVVRDAAFPEVSQGRTYLRAATKELPPALELRYRHAITPGDGFEMLPGLRSFQRVLEGEVLAENRWGKVRSPERGRLLMPLYQPQGEDGFFLIREFHPSWLTFSEILRRLRADRIIHWLPGIRRHSPDSRSLLVDRRWARWFTLEILHLLGYRKEVEEGDQLVVLKEVE
jgi:succinylglutamate desuccinylase